MNPEIKKFIFKIVFAAFLMTVLGFFVFIFLLPDGYLPILPWMLLFFSVVVIITHSYQLRLAQKNMGRFTRSSMVISMLRLMVYSFFALIYIASNQENVAVFVVSLVFIYSVFTVMEITDISRIVRKK